MGKEMTNDPNKIQEAVDTLSSLKHSFSSERHAGAMQSEIDAIQIAIDALKSQKEISFNIEDVARIDFLDNSSIWNETPIRGGYESGTELWSVQIRDDQHPSCRKPILGENGKIEFFSSFREAYQALEQRVDTLNKCKGAIHAN